MNLSLWWVGTLMLRLRESDIDCSGGNPAQKASVKSIQDLCLDFDLVDKGRIRNPTARRFTWQRNPFIQIGDVCQEDITCCVRLHVVGCVCCYTKVEIGQTFQPTTPNIYFVP